MTIMEFIPNLHRLNSCCIILILDHHKLSPTSHRSYLQLPPSSSSLATVIIFVFSYCKLPHTTVPPRTEKPSFLPLTPNFSQLSQSLVLVLVTPHTHLPEPPTSLFLALTPLNPSSSLHRLEPPHHQASNDSDFVSHNH
ncbi:hypothetical protein VNO77_35196 [Canavalia gladiata]|uniref:Uncharacterized protein n=1 Tax=Canavalia gladiata TaxID=3824 RepID=A0AAN9KG86_CANGL